MSLFTADVCSTATEFPLPVRFTSYYPQNCMRAFFLCLIALNAAGQRVDSSLLNDLEWRSLGPAAMGGRISGIEGVPGNPRLLYAATGSGGLFKTTNGGTTWQAIFERPSTISIGDIAIDPKHPDTIWVGTGEANLRNSVSFGAGMYYSGDGGKTWGHRGLDATMTISRVALDPRDSHLFGPNLERGVFFSPDAGRSWQKVLYIDEYHGASDLDIDPSNPDIVFAGLWKFDRKPWRYDSGSTGGGLYKSSDGGKTWKKITRGLPALMGRIGVKVAPSNPRVVYVVAESKEGSLFRSNDGGESFETISKERDLTNRGYYYCDLRVDPKNERRVYVLSNALMLSNDGAKASPASEVRFTAIFRRSGLTQSIRRAYGRARTVASPLRGITARRGSTLHQFRSASFTMCTPTTGSLFTM